MSVLQLTRMFVSPHAGWREIALSRPSISRLFWSLVFPLALIPPAMLEYFGNRLGATLLPGRAPAQWTVVALVVLGAELLTVPLMALGIRSIAASKGVPGRLGDCFAIAALTPLPLWMAALALFSADASLIATVTVLAAIASSLLVFHGVQTVLKVREGVIAVDIAITASALGVFVWGVPVAAGLAAGLT